MRDFISLIVDDRIPGGCKAVLKSILSVRVMAGAGFAKILPLAIAYKTLFIKTTHLPPVIIK